MTSTTYHKLMLMALGAGVMFDDSLTFGGRTNRSRKKELSPEMKEALKLEKQENLKKLKLKRGCSIYHLNGMDVIALNQENAKRKAAKFIKLMEEAI